nr:unnamed protein product [Leishmania braziliensis]
MSEHVRTNAGLPPMSPVDLAPRWMMVDAGLTTPAPALAASASSSMPVAAAPFVRNPVAMHRTSHRGVDPYQVCQAYVNQLLELQGEQVSVAQSLRAVLRIAFMHAEPIFGAESTSGSPKQAGAARLVVDSVENVFPGCRGSNSSRLHQQRPTSTGAEAGFQPTPTSSSSPSLMASITSLVHRLHVLQRESAEFSATRCLPSLAELFGTFEMYWAWKRSQICDGGVQEEEESDTIPVSASAAVTRSAVDGATTASGVSQNGPNQHQRPPTLRQRYDQALRARDELLSFLQLHAEAVRAFDAQLEQWCRCGDVGPAARSTRGWLTVSPAGTGGAPVAVSCDADTQAQAQRREFEAYTCELVEVAQTTRHIAQLLQAALRALCRPAAARGTVPSPKPRAAAGMDDEGAFSTSQRLPQTGRNVVYSPGIDTQRLGGLQARSSVNTGGLTSSCTSAKRVGTYLSTELSGRSPSSPAPHTSSTVSSSACGLCSPLSPKARTLKVCVKPGQCNDSRSVNGAEDAVQGSWMNTLSPLTPPPTAATASASPSSTPPHHIEPNEPHSQLRRQRRSRRRLTPSPSPHHPAAQEEGRASLYASPSTADAVSLSPLTVQRGAATAVAGVVPAAQSREASADRGQHCLVPTPSAASQGEEPGSAEEDNGVQAAVSPVVTLRLAVDGSATHDRDGNVVSRLSTHAEHPSWSRRHCLSQDGARSLLRELASASVDATVCEGARLSNASQLADSRFRGVVEGAASADSERQTFAEATADVQDATAVYVPPPCEQRAHHHGDSPATATTVVLADVMESSEGRAASQSPPSPSPQPPCTSATHTVSTVAAACASVSHKGSASLHFLSPRSLSMDSDAGRGTTCGECGGLDEEGCLSVGRAASIPTSLWPRLPHKAASRSSSAALVLATTDAAGGAQLAHNTTVPASAPSHSLSKEPEGGDITASKYFASPPVDPNFYTARDSGTDVSLPPAPAATFHASVSSARPELSPKPPQQTQHSEQQQQQQQQGHQEHHVQEWDHTFSPTPLLLDSLERELGESQQRPQVPAPPRHSSPAFSASSAAPGNPAGSGEPGRLLEERVVLTMHEELKALRAEQRHSLHKMRKYVKHALEEVAEAVSAAGSCNHSSRGSSRTSSRSHHPRTANESNHSSVDVSTEGTRATVAAGRQRYAVRASQQAQTESFSRSNETASVSASIKTSSSSATLPSRLLTTQQRQTAPAVPASLPSKEEELQRSLAVAEAKATRLEQLTVQLKKRLWLAELSRLSPMSATSGVREPEAAVKRCPSLRDALIYGLSSDAGDTEDDDGSLPNVGQAAASQGYSRGSSTAAGGVAVEERAMLYLVDRELGYHTPWDAPTHPQRRPSTFCRTTSEVPRSSLQVSHDGSCSSSSTEHERLPSLWCFEGNTAAHFSPSVSLAPTGITERLDSRRLCSSSAAPSSTTGVASSTRSLGILRQRASIFEVLRRGHAARDAQSSAPTGQQQQREASQLSPPPPPPLQHSSAGTAVEAPAELTAAAQSTTYSSPSRQAQKLCWHPYNAEVPSSRDQRKPMGKAATGFPKQSVSSRCYTDISGGSGTGSVAGAGLGSSASVSTLRAEQALQNAKRLLQSRNVALAAGHRGINVKCHSSAPLAGDTQPPFTAASSPKTPAETGQYSVQMPYLQEGGSARGAAAVPVSPLIRPGQWGDCMEQLETVSSSSRAFVPAALHAGMTDTASALQRVSGLVDRCAADFSTVNGGCEPRSHFQSPESAYHHYDTSPCSAVAYSTSKVPRSSSPSGAKAALKLMEPSSTPPATAADSSLPVAVFHAATDVTTALQAQRRVDSATSPISREDAEVRAAAGGRGERGASIHSDITFPHRERSARNAMTFTDRGYSPLSDCTTDARSTRGLRSSSPLHATAKQRVHDNRHEVPAPLISRAGQSTSRLTAYSTSPTLSCGSAQQQLLDTLKEEESTLATALGRLQDQQRQLREKHQQVSLLAKQIALATAARASSRGTRVGDQRAAGGAAAAAATAGKQLTSGFHGSRSGNVTAEAAATSRASADCHRLLKRFAAAESSLAEREGRVQRALWAVQRQRSALSRHDLL